jgi:hypothetical protein
LENRLCAEELRTLTVILVFKKGKKEMIVKTEDLGATMG